VVVCHIFLKITRKLPFVKNKKNYLFARIYRYMFDKIDIVKNDN
jgi:hypothetical protein